MFKEEHVWVKMEHVPIFCIVSSEDMNFLSSLLKTTEPTLKTRAKKVLLQIYQKVELLLHLIQKIVKSYKDLFL